LRILILRKTNKKKAFGLDIGTASVKMIRLQKSRGGYEVTKAGYLKIDSSSGDNNSNTVQAVKDCVKSSGTAINSAVCSISGSEVAVRNFKFPGLSHSEIEGAVQLEASQVCPFNIDNSTVDYQMLSTDQENTSGILVAATNEQIDKKKNIAQEASLDTAMVDVDGLALINCLNEVEDLGKDTSVAVLNVGNTYTNLVIMGNDSAPFVRDISYASKDIIDYIANEKGITPEKIHEILFADVESVETEFVLGDCLEAACGQLITDIIGTIRHHRTHTNTEAVEKLHVCGGFASAKGFVDILNEKLPVETVLWNPFDKMACDLDEAGKEMLQKNGPAMAVAAGLAMRAI
jgi:type IV pilus assembly protein PilM